MNEPVVLGEVLLGKYRVERLLGQGGMGVVVAVRHVDLGQLHAMKLLLPTALANQEAHERFLREARAAARLTSEHVVRVQDVGYMANGVPYMIMEYLEGCDLKALLSKQGRLSVSEAVTYLLQVCEAMTEAHAAGIVHRDLKPANLFLVRRRFSRPCIKVVDFGISKQTGPNETELTSLHATLGSPLYMSPEQMGRAKMVDGRTDIWALGVILYELLTGTTPFEGVSVVEVTSRVLQEEPAPLRELQADIPEDLEALVNKCLRKRPEERYQTVPELHAALARFGPPELSAPQSIPFTKTSDAVGKTSTTIGGATPLSFGRADKSAKEKKLWTLVPFAIVVGIVVGAMTFFLTQWTDESDSTSVSIPVTNSIQMPMVAPRASVSSVKEVKLEPSAVPQVQPSQSAVVIAPAPTTVKFESVPIPPAPTKTNNKKRHRVN